MVSPAVKEKASYMQECLLIKSFQPHLPKDATNCLSILTPALTLAGVATIYRAISNNSYIIVSQVAAS